MSSSVFAACYLVAQMNIIYGSDFRLWDKHQLFLSSFILFFDYIHLMGRMIIQKLITMDFAIAKKLNKSKNRNRLSSVLKAIVVCAVLSSIVRQNLTGSFSALRIFNSVSLLMCMFMIQNLFHKCSASAVGGKRGESSMNSGFFNLGVLPFVGKFFAAADNKMGGGAGGGGGGAGLGGLGGDGNSSSGAEGDGGGGGGVNSSVGVGGNSAHARYSSSSSRYTINDGFWHAILQGCLLCFLSTVSPLLSVFSHGYSFDSWLAQSNNNDFRDADVANINNNFAASQLEYATFDTEYLSDSSEPVPGSANSVIYSRRSALLIVFFSIAHLSVLQFMYILLDRRLSFALCAASVSNCSGAVSPATSSSAINAAVGSESTASAKTGAGAGSRMNNSFEADLEEVPVVINVLTFIRGLVGFILRFPGCIIRSLVKVISKTKQPINSYKNNSRNSDNNNSSSNNSDSGEECGLLVRWLLRCELRIVGGPSKSPLLSLGMSLFLLLTAAECWLALHFPAQRWSPSIAGVALSSIWICSRIPCWPLAAVAAVSAVTSASNSSVASTSTTDGRGKVPNNASK